VGLLVAALAAAGAAPARAERSPFRPAPVPEPPPLPAENPTACRYQRALPFLVHANFTIRPETPREEWTARKALAEQAIRYRTERYGHVPGFGRPLWNLKRPADSARWTRFMGLPIQLNERILPALACVEDRILIECAATTYRPWKLSGLRFENTHYNFEVSNHLYGIAVDVDPGRNTCCGCVPPWSEHPSCLAEAETIFERMAMPACWVDVFERFGFYWLGRGRIQDTMHFEFLGDPEKIAR
jgi:hypothetical protein